MTNNFVLDTLAKIGVTLHPGNYYETDIIYKSPGRGKILIDDIEEVIVFDTRDFGSYYHHPVALVVDLNN
jgi:hypothetical protein